MRDLFVTVSRAVRRRPVRVAEALIVLAGTLGLAIDPDAAAAILTLVTVAVAAGEVAQTKTTPVVDPRLDDGHRSEAG